MGGTTLKASATPVPARGRAHPRHVPHPASAAITGKAKLPTPLLNSASGAHHRGRSIHPVAPWANALAPVRSAGSATIRNRAAPAPRAAAIANGGGDPDPPAPRRHTSGRTAKDSRSGPITERAPQWTG